MYDPPIGRFWQIDPLADVNENSSPYSFAYNRPINYNDPSGLDTSWKELQTLVFTYRPPQEQRSDVNVDLAAIASYSLFLHNYIFIPQVDRTIATPSTWWQRFVNGPVYKGKNLLGEDVYQEFHGGLAESGSFSRFNPKDILKLYKVIKNLLWSSRAVAQAAKLLLRGASEVTVKNKDNDKRTIRILFEQEKRFWI